jgi:iron complex transport system substrate-binding protein
VAHADYISVEQLGDDLGSVDVIVYGVGADGSIEPTMADLMTSPLWQNLPAVQAGNVVEVRHHSAATYQTAILALESIDEGLAALPANAG